MTEPSPSSQVQHRSLAEYRRRIDRAVRYILLNIDRPISLDELAEQACFSKYHFHRLFTAVMNEPPGEYVTRKKLERAAIRLAYANAPVSRLAGDYGYSSVAAFSKAFKQWFGCRPTALKSIRERLGEGDGKLQRRHGKQLMAEELFLPGPGADDTGRQEALERQVRIEQVGAFELHCLASPGGYDLSSVGETWARLTARVQGIADPDACDWFSLSHDHPGLTPAAQCRYEACVALPAAARGALDLPTVRVPAGLFAVYPVEGPPTSILGQYLEFYTLWMPQSGYEPADYPILEHYLPGSRPEHLRVELWARIEPIRYG